MKGLSSKAGIPPVLIMFVIIAMLGWYGITVFNNVKESKEITQAIRDEGTDIILIVEQDINWKTSINNLDKISWTNGEKYNYDKDKSIEEQQLPDFITLTESDEKYPTKTCSVEYDVCGAVIRVKDATTGEVINTVKDEELIDDGESLFSIYGSLVNVETTTTSDRVWKDDLDKNPDAPTLYTDLTYDIEIYTVKDGERVVQGITSGETSNKWLLGIPNITWGNTVVEDPGKSIVVHTVVSVRD